MQTKPKVLFLSTGNSTRGQMSEGFLRTVAADRFIAASAGIKPGDLDPMAIEVMEEIGIDIRRQVPKDVAQAVKEHFAYVVALYDATKERSPIFPFTFHLLRWSLVDPTMIQGTDAERKKAFRMVRDEIHERIQCLLGETAEKKQEHEHGVLAYS